MKMILKHWMSCLPDSIIEADIDAGRRLVRLRLDHFDSHHVATFVTRVLLEQGVVAFRDDSAVERVGQLTPPAPFQLAFFLGGQEHAAQVVRLADGQLTVWLENPSKGHKRRLKVAATRALQLLHEAGWEAIVIDDVATGAITPDSKAEVRIDDRQRAISEDEFRRLRDLIGAETSYDAFVERASSYVAGTFETMLRFPHLAWDSKSGSVVERSYMEKTRSPAPSEELRRGTVSRLNQEAGFGYVDDDDGVHSYIFVFGHAIKHSNARQLSVGARVRFRVEERGRVSNLQLT